MDTHSLRLFIDVATTGSFAQVARARECDPSSVSRTIAGLEMELGLRLFQRTTRSVTLTEAGETYFARVLPIIEELDAAGEAASELQGKPLGTLRLTASVAFMEQKIVPILGRFRSAYPALDLDLLATDEPINLVEQHVDLAVRLGAQLEGDMIVSKLMPTRYSVYAAPTYLASAPRIETPHDLEHHPCVVFRYPGYRSSWMFRDSSGNVTTVPVRSDTLASNALVILRAAETGLGPALLADWTVDGAVRAGTLVDLFPNFEVAAQSFDTAAWLVYPSRAFVPAKVRAMIQFLREHIP